MCETSSKLNIKAVIFDLDGVITKTALVHSAAWKEMFDEYLRMRESRDNEPFKEFTYKKDYLTYVDGKPRYKGVQSFLESRKIQIPYGHVSDPFDAETVCGLGNRKNVKFLEVLNKSGIQVYDSTVDLIKDLKKNGVHVAVASSSKNCQHVLKVTALEEFFEARVDGVVSFELGLKGKPEGDIFVKAAEMVGILPKDAVVVEDAVSGVQAGASGGFGLVIGVAREKNVQELKNNGADVVVEDFKGITTEELEAWFNQKNIH